MIVGITAKDGFTIIGQPLEVIGLELAVMVHPDGHRERVTGVELSGKYNIADGIHHAIPEGCHVEIDGRRVGFA